MRSTRSAGNRQRIHRRRKTFVKRVLYLAVAALVAMLILVPTAMAQEAEMKMKMEQTVEKDLPKSGGVGVGSLVLPAAALLIGGGVLGYAVLRRR
jgi:LPXTG cell wall anchor motif